MGVCGWHHAAGWHRDDVKYWFKIDKKTYDFNKSERKKIHDELFKKGIFTGS